MGAGDNAADARAPSARRQTLRVCCDAAARPRDLPVKEPRAACLPAAAMPEGRHHVYGTPGPWPPPQRDIPGEETSTIGVRFEMMPNGEVHVSEVSPLSTAPVREHTVPPFAQRLCLCGNDFV